MLARLFLFAAPALLAPAGATGAISYLTQDRTISAATSFDGGMQTISAADFGPFVDVAQLAVTFPAVGGGTGENAARAGIDCHLDPNLISVIGDLSASGGLAVGGLDPLFGEARISVAVSFEITDASPFFLMANPRPSAFAGDRFKLVFKQLDGAAEVFVDLDESTPPEAVNLSGQLAPGLYEVEYEVQFTSFGDDLSSSVAFSLQVPGPSALAVLGLPIASRARRRRRC